MSRRAWAFYCFVIGTSLALVGLALTQPAQMASTFPAFVVLTVLATLAQLFKASLKSNQKSERGTTTYSPKLIVLFAGVYLLSPPLLVLLYVIPHVVDWVKERLTRSANLPKWYIQPFNIATYLVAGLTAQWIFIASAGEGAALWSWIAVAAAVVGAAAFVLINHLLVGFMLVLARGVTLRESGVMDIDNLASDVIQLCLGYVIAILWTLNPLLILLALSPLVMIYRALTVPQLKRDAQTDLKTGLANAGHFVQAFKAEFERARIQGQPVSVIMADLDQLRSINNTYGHLAGDDVLAGIGRIIKDSIRPNDIAGRFGGDEFCIVLPELGPQEAQIVAEKLCLTIASTGFVADTLRQPIHATTSVGVAAFPADAASSTDLLRQADIALYQAKLRGRNQVVGSWDVPHSIRLTGMGAPNTEAAPQVDSEDVERYVRNRGVGAPNTEALPQPRDIAPITEAAPQPHDTAPKAEAAAGDTNAQRSGAVSRGPAADHMASEPAVKAYPKMWLWLFVGGTVAAALSVAVLGLIRSSVPDMVALAVLSVLAVITQLPQTKNLYDQSSVSVSVTVNFAAALIAGILGVICVSGVIALAHFIQRKPAVYKTFFNFATHVLAGAAPVLALAVFGLQEQVTNLLLVIVPVCVAALTYFVIDTGLIAVAISLSTAAIPSVTWRKQFRWLAPYYFVLCLMGLFLSIAYFALGILGVGVFTLPVLMMAYVQKQYKDRTEASTNELQRMYQELGRANHEVSTANQAIQELNEELFQVTAKIIDTRDPFASGHATKVAEYAVAVATEMGLPSERIDVIRHAAFLHDIGKLGTPEVILMSGSKLDEQQTEIVRRHPALGAEFLQTSQTLRHLAPFVRSHHERWDGRGYPDGLAGEMIPLEARILGACDAVEAMASDRPYHPGLPLPQVTSELKRCSGKHFDPAVVEAFLRVIARDGNSLIVNSADEVARSQELAKKW